MEAVQGPREGPDGAALVDFVPPGYKIDRSDCFGGHYLRDGLAQKRQAEGGPPPRYVNHKSVATSHTLRS
jgi:hypothetical protein